MGLDKNSKKCEREKIRHFEAMNSESVPTMRLGEIREKERESWSLENIMTSTLTLRLGRDQKRK